MPLTIVDYSDPYSPDVPDGSVVNALEGTVKVAWDVKPAKEEGGKTFPPQQGFVLANDLGELAITLKGEDGKPFHAVQKGDRVKISAQPHRRTGAPSGTKIRSYEKDGKRVRTLDVYARCLQNLTRPQAPEPTQEHAPGNSTPPAPSQPAALLSLDAARTLYRQEFEAAASLFRPKVSEAATTFEGFVYEAPEALLSICHDVALALLQAALDGKLAPRKRSSGAPPPPPPPPQDPDIPEDDIPF